MRGGGRDHTGPPRWAPAAAFVATALVTVVSAAGWVSAQSHDSKSPPEGTRKAVKPADLGVEVVALRPTAGGRLLDFRVRVLNPDKSMPLLGRRPKQNVSLLDERTGRAIEAARTQIGTLRSTTESPVTGRVYSILFENQGLFEGGDEATLLVGNMRLEHLAVAAASQVPVPKSRSGTSR